MPNEANEPEANAALAGRNNRLVRLPLRAIFLGPGEHRCSFCSGRGVEPSTVTTSSTVCRCCGGSGKVWAI